QQQREASQHKGEKHEGWQNGQPPQKRPGGVPGIRGHRPGAANGPRLAVNRQRSNHPSDRRCENVPGDERRQPSFATKVIGFRTPRAGGTAALDEDLDDGHPSWTRRARQAVAAGKSFAFGGAIRAEYYAWPTFRARTTSCSPRCPVRSPGCWSRGTRAARSRSSWTASRWWTSGAGSPTRTARPGGG